MIQLSLFPRRGFGLLLDLGSHNPRELAIDYETGEPRLWKAKAYARRAHRRQPLYLRDVTTVVRVEVHNEESEVPTYVIE